MDDCDKLVSFGQRDVCFLSSHDLVEVTYDIQVEKTNSRTITVRDYSNFHREAFLYDLSDNNLSVFINICNINKKIMRFYEHLMDCLNKHASLKIIYPRHLPAPWITAEIRAVMVSRNKQQRNMAST